MHDIEKILFDQDIYFFQNTVKPATNQSLLVFAYNAQSY